MRGYESQFIFEPESDSHSYFQVFNSVIKEENGKTMIKRISSDRNGYNGINNDEFDYKEHFGYGYNEKTLKK